MAQIKPVIVNDTDNIVPLEETVNIVSKSFFIRQSEVEILRTQVSLLELELKNLTEEYGTYLKFNDFIDDNVSPESLISYPQVSSAVDPEVVPISKSADYATILIPNPSFMPISIALEEADELLGPVEDKIRWYQNEINKKYILKEQIMLRVEMITSREGE